MASWNESEAYKKLKASGMLIDLDWILERITSPDNWTDDFFEEVDDFYAENFNAIRSTLTKAKMWEKFDTAFCEWKKPGQKALTEPVPEKKKPDSDTFGISGSNKVTFVTLVTLVQNKKIQLPSFPVECLPEKIRTYTKAVAESLQVPTDMISSFVLAIMALCVQGKWWLNVKPDWIESLNLYIVVVGRPSERKSPALKEVIRPIFLYTQEENERRKPDISEYELKKKILSGKLRNIQDALANPKRNKDKYTLQDALDCQKEMSELKEVNFLKLIVDDITPEALVKTMKENNERMGLISAEGGIFGMMAGRYSSNANIDIFLKGYSGEYYSSGRIGREDTDLKQPYLTIGLAVQPQIIADIMENKDFRGRGLLARFLYTVPNTRVGERNYKVKKVDPSVRKEYDDLCDRLLRIDDLDGFAKRIINLSPEADKLAEEYYYWIERQLINELEDIEDWAGKLHGNTMRIAGILHIVEHMANAQNIPISAETMKSAIEIGKYYLEHSKAAFDIMGLSEPKEVRDAKYIISRLETYDKSDFNDFNSKNIKSSLGDKRDKSDFNDFIPKRDALRLCKRFKTAEEMQLGLDCLVEHGYIAVVKESNGKGRPSEKIYINPEYYKWKDEHK